MGVELFMSFLKIWSVAIRGRPIINSSTVQRIELGSDKYANCITTVSKDSMILIGERNSDCFCSHFEK